MPSTMCIHWPNFEVKYYITCQIWSNMLKTCFWLYLLQYSIFLHVILNRNRSAQNLSGACLQILIRAIVFKLNHMKMYKHAKLGNFLIHAPICMILPPNDALHKDKKLSNYMCNTKYASFQRFFKTKRIFVLYSFVRCVFHYVRQQNFGFRNLRNYTSL